MQLQLFPEPYCICRLDADEPVPDWAIGTFVSVTRTPDELSIVCPDSVIPEAGLPAGAKSECGWRYLKAVGPFQFSEVGIVASLASPLAAAQVPIFVISTFDTDWLLIHRRFSTRQLRRSKQRSITSSDLDLESESSDKRLTDTQ